MLAPGAKGWISKYIDLVEKKEIVLSVSRPVGLRKLHFMHLTYANSGLVFGFPSRRIFSEHLDDSDWTKEEKLKVLLFEAHLFAFLQINKNQAFNKDLFLDNLFDFYAHHNASAIKKVFAFFMKEGREEKLENILAKRVDIKINLLENKWWVNSLSNAFAYLDVILFDDFVHKKNDEALKGYTSYAQNAIVAIILAAYSDGEVEPLEKRIFNVFLASANLPEDSRDNMKHLMKKGASYDNLSPFVKEHWLLKRFVLDIAILTTISNEDIYESEYEFLKDLCSYLEIPTEELDQNLGLIENFIITTNKEIEFMRHSPSYEKVYSSLSKRWSKILLRNKDKLTIELRESKELIALVKKSATEELSNEEKEMVKSQFKDIVRSIPTLTIFMLPGGTILLPLLLKMIPDLVPSAFRENEIKSQEDNHDNTVE